MRSGGAWSTRCRWMVWAMGTSWVVAARASLTPSREHCAARPWCRDGESMAAGCCVLCLSCPVQLPCACAVTVGLWARWPRLGDGANAGAAEWLACRAWQAEFTARNDSHLGCTGSIWRGQSPAVGVVWSCRRCRPGLCGVLAANPAWALARHRGRAGRGVEGPGPCPWGGRLAMWAMAHGPGSHGGGGMTEAARMPLSCGMAARMVSRKQRSLAG